ncbi:hypothetical protein LG307_14875 [Sutcliffiella horikoshii]|uniref:hypothetical protein n=1 Tax=Sutcliffiella horikoshii TaxID=79883 RepID=UPI00384A4DDA
MSKRLIHITEEELKDLIYFHCKSACNQLYKGLSNHHFKNIELDMASLIEDVHYIKTYLQSLPEQRGSLKGEEVAKAVIKKLDFTKLVEEDSDFEDESPKKKKTPRRKTREVSALELQEAMRNNQIKQDD